MFGIEFHTLPTERALTIILDEGLNLGSLISDSLAENTPSGEDGNSHDNQDDNVLESNGTLMLLIHEIRKLLHIGHSFHKIFIKLLPTERALTIILDEGLNLGSFIGDSLAENTPSGEDSNSHDNQDDNVLESNGTLMLLIHKLSELVHVVTS